MSLSSRSSCCEDLHVLRSNVVWSVQCYPTFRRNILPPSSGSNKSIKTRLCLQSAFTFIFRKGLLLERRRGATTLRNVVDFQRTIQSSIPEDRTVQKQKVIYIGAYYMLRPSHGLPYHWHCLAKNNRLIRPGGLSVVFGPGDAVVGRHMILRI
jgi:hypothetical protein